MKLERITVQAVMSQVVPVAAMVNRIMAQLNCTPRTRMQIKLAVDELFSNIVHYAYGDGEGTITVEVKELENPPCLAITFIDQGIPYNPLTVREPELTGPARVRRVGGLGLYLVRKSMDSVSYEYKDNSNYLTVRKQI